MPRYEGFGPPYNPGPNRHWEYTSTSIHHYEVPEVSHQESRLKSSTSYVVMSNRFVPHGRYATLEEAQQKMQSRYRDARDLSDAHPAQFVYVNKRKVLRRYYVFTATGASVGLDTSKQRGSLVNIEVL